MTTSPSVDPLCTRLMKAYWRDRQALIDGHARMAAVMQELAEVIRTWAPDEGQARICHLAINEVADRLVRESNCNH